MKLTPHCSYRHAEHYAVCLSLLLAGVLTGADLPVAAPAAKPAVDAAKYLDPKLPDCGLQKAIDAAAALDGGGIVKIPEGTFALRRGLVLKSKVELQGAGMDKTILMPLRKEGRMDVLGSTAGAETNTWVITVNKIPDNLDVGMGVMLCPSFPPGHVVYTRPGCITALDRKALTVTVLAPYGGGKMQAGKGVITAGLQYVVERDVKKGDTEITLKSVSQIEAGDELTLGEPENESMLAHVFVKEIKGNTLVLEQPAGKDYALWPPREKFGNTYYQPLVWVAYPLIHNANVSDMAIRDLTVKGHGLAEVYPINTRYTVSGIHFYNSKRLVIERVAVRDWPADGISLQVAADDKVLNCEVTGCLGNGFHPGTGTQNMLFEGNLSTRNGSGFYFCWSNTKNLLRENKFIKNKGGGITGLGNPSDLNNTIEKNLVAENGGPGIEINGGNKSGNIIRDNIIENNSQGTPGKNPGIALWAAVEDARNYTITGNTIRDSQTPPTQYVGIEEKSGSRNGKPTAADDNIIKGNKFSGHQTADIVTVGANTLCEDNGDAKVVKGPLAPPAPPKK